MNGASHPSNTGPCRAGMIAVMDAPVIHISETETIRDFAAILG